MAKTKELPWLPTMDEMLKNKADFREQYIFDPDGQIFQTPFGAGY